MPDPILMGKAFAVALVLAMATAVFFRQLFHSIGVIPALVVGTFAGLWMLQLLPHFPPHDILDRLLVIILPAAAIAELVAAASNKLGWCARALVAILTIPAILYGSTFVTDLTGPGSREWSTQKAVVICSIGGLALFAAWTAMDRLAVRRSSRVPLWVVAGVLQAAGVTIMLSGYATGGQLAIPLAASLVGVGLPSITRRNYLRAESALGVGIVALFALVAIGRFFAGLTDVNAALLLVAPLLAWLPQYVPSGSRVRIALQLALPAIAATVALILAQQKFAADSM